MKFYVLTNCIVEFLRSKKLTIIFFVSGLHLYRSSPAGMVKHLLDVDIHLT